MSFLANENRRYFLIQSGAALLGTGALAAGLRSDAADSAWNPILACRDTHLKDIGAADAWAAVKAIGASGVEVDVDIQLNCVNLFHPQKKYSLATSEALETLKKDAEQNGVKITAFCMHNQFDRRPDEEVKWAAAMVNAAKALNVKVIRVDFAPGKIKGDEYLPFAVSMGKRLVDLVKDTDIRYGIENHGNTTNRPEFLDKLFDGVGSKALGLTLDTGNFYWYGHPLNDLYKIFEQYASRVFHTHCKSIRYPEEKRNTQRPMGWEYEKYTCPIYEGDIDFRKIISILKAANYSGDFCVEDESLGKFPKEKKGEILKKEIAFLQSLL